MTSPCIIAEIGSNHNLQLSRALALISAAADTGATHVKFQAWDTAHLYSSHYPELYARFQHLQVPASWWPTLAGQCQRKGVSFLCTPFDIPSLEAIHPYVAEIKIASGDLTNTMLLHAVAAKGKPVLLSTGAATLDEIAEAVTTLAAAGATQVTLLHCVSAYPTPIAQANLRAIRSLSRRFPTLDVGYSDHTANLWCCLAAYILGAEVIEVHFDLGDGQGQEAGHSLSPEGLKALTQAIRGHGLHWSTAIWSPSPSPPWQEAFMMSLLAQGDGDKHPLPVEESERDWARRGLYTTRPVRQREPLHDALLPLRPARGVEGQPRPYAASAWLKARAMYAARDLPAGWPLSEQDVMEKTDL